MLSISISGARRYKVDLVELLDVSLVTAEKVVFAVAKNVCPKPTTARALLLSRTNEPLTPDAISSGGGGTAGTAGTAGQVAAAAKGGGGTGGGVTAGLPSVVGPGMLCSTYQSTHFKPSFIDLNGTL